jgi:tetraacyldisaccharide 4'-kinase
LLPAGPLREPMPAQVPARTIVVYTGRGPSTPLAGEQVPRRAAMAVPLQAWRDGQAGHAAIALAGLRGRRLTALAGIAAPAQFFAMLREAGLEIEELAAPDHANYTVPPWPRGTLEVVTTEKDAVKLTALPGLADGATRVWVVPLDCELPAPIVQRLLQWTESS